MKISQIFLVVFLSAAVAFGVGQYGKTRTEKTVTKETAFERVKRTGVIRCGFIPWAPFFTIDPNTGKKEGIAYDYAGALEKELELKFEWVEEAGYGNFHEGLNSGRYDAMCTPVFESGQRAKIALLTDSLFENGWNVFVRESDTRFDEDINALNQKEVKIMTIDGDITQVIRRLKFPHSTEKALPSMIDIGQYMLNVATGKVDAGFIVPFSVTMFNKGATDRLKILSPEKPIHVFGNSIAVRLGEQDFKMMLDAAIHALRRSGQAEAITKNYESFFLKEE